MENLNYFSPDEHDVYTELTAVPPVLRICARIGAESSGVEDTPQLFHCVNVSGERLEIQLDTSRMVYLPSKPPSVGEYTPNLPQQRHILAVKIVGEEGLWLVMCIKSFIGWLVYRPIFAVAPI